MFTTDLFLYWASYSHTVQRKRPVGLNHLVWGKSKERRRKHTGVACGHCVSLQRCDTSSDFLSEDMTQASRSVFALQCQALSPACSHLLGSGRCSVVRTQVPVTLVSRPEGGSKFLDFVGGRRDLPHELQDEEDTPKGNMALTWYNCYHLMQEWGGAVADSILLQGKSNSNEFLKSCWVNSACLFRPVTVGFL